MSAITAQRLKNIKGLSFKDNFMYFFNLIDSPRNVSIYFYNILVVFIYSYFLVSFGISVSSTQKSN